ncbi:MAG: hypothetical protein NTZ46_01995 [Verrucomicrobia bacterium]|nr:hypothetical protein [Verrucomicrobiota bacterium]
MKQTTQWVAALFTVASAGLALGCGCERVRLEPVRERMVQRTVCSVRQPVVIQRTRCVRECSSRLWTTPTQANTPYVITHVYTRPAQPEIVAAYDDLAPIEPVGERLTTTSYVNRPLMPRRVAFQSEPIFQPVGERITTIRTVRTRPVLQPVRERVTTVCTLRARPVLEPVAERTVIRRTYVSPWSACD